MTEESDTLGQDSLPRNLFLLDRDELMCEKILNTLDDKDEKSFSSSELRKHINIQNELQSKLESKVWVQTITLRIYAWCNTDFV